MKKHIVKAILIFLFPFFISVFIIFMEGDSIDYIKVMIVSFPTAIFTTYFSFRRFYLIYKLSKVGVEVTAYYRVLINAALGLSLVKVEFELNGKEELCCIYTARTFDPEKYKLLIDPNNFKHYLIMGVEKIA